MLALLWIAMERRIIEGVHHQICYSRCPRFQEIEDELRSAILQIDKSSVHLPSRHGCTFALHVEAHEHSMTNGEEQKVNKWRSFRAFLWTTPEHVGLRSPTRSAKI